MGVLCTTLYYSLVLFLPSVSSLLLLVSVSLLLLLSFSTLAILTTLTINSRKSSKE